jgi:phosphomannomutase
MALVLHLLAETGQTIAELVNTLPRFSIIKEKLVCPSDKIAAVLRMIRQEYAVYPLDLRDGVKVDLPNGWFLVRGSNTEPIIRVIAEAEVESHARGIFERVYAQVQECIA